MLVFRRGTHGNVVRLALRPCEGDADDRGLERIEAGGFGVEDEAWLAA